VKYFNNINDIKKIVKMLKLCSYDIFIILILHYSHRAIINNIEFIENVIRL